MDDSCSFGKVSNLGGGDILLPKNWPNPAINDFPENDITPAATLKPLKYYAVVPSLIDEASDRIILYGGCNDVNNKNSTPEKVANEIGDMAKLCRGYGVNDIFVSAMICRRSKFLNKKVKHINFLLKLISEDTVLQTLKLEIYGKMVYIY